jgi:hypothetical protein
MERRSLNHCSLGPVEIQVLCNHQVAILQNDNNDFADQPKNSIEDFELG